MKFSIFRSACGFCYIMYHGVNVTPRLNFPPQLLHYRARHMQRYPLGFAQCLTVHELYPYRFFHMAPAMALCGGWFR